MSEDGSSALIANNGTANGEGDALDFPSFLLSASDMTRAET